MASTRSIRREPDPICEVRAKPFDAPFQRACGFRCEREFAGVANGFVNRSAEVRAGSPRLRSGWVAARVSGWKVEDNVKH